MFTTAIHGETLIKTILHNGIPMELLRVPPTIWCGSIAYASNLTDEPDISALLAKYQANANTPSCTVPVPNGTTASVSITGRRAGFPEEWSFPSR